MLEHHPDATRTTVAGSIAAAQSLLASAHEDGQAIMPCGRGSRLRRNLPGARPDRWLSLAGMQEMVWLDVEDQTCAVQAGMTVSALQERLHPHGLMLEVLTPGETHGTLGGLFQAREHDLLEASCGPLRDQVLGGTWLLADGTLVKTGARVVKSVAGYDVTRLFLGARGRLAICLELILRLRPIPRLQWFRGTSEDRGGGLPEPRLCLALEGKRQLLAFADLDLQDPRWAPVAEEEAQALVQTHLQEVGTGRFDPPLPADSPWLSQLAEACAPGVPHLGAR